MTEINSYIGCVQMNDIQKLLTRQLQNGSQWAEIIQDKHPEINLLKFSENAMPNYWVFGMLVPDKLKYINLFREQGYFASGVHLNNNEYSVFKNHEILSGTKAFYNKFIALPSGWWSQISEW
jgi:dTDP-4-amino-4,6-dideoxygalactose transaminase